MKRKKTPQMMLRCASATVNSVLPDTCRKLCYSVKRALPAYLSRALVRVACSSAKIAAAAGS
jgi:hypothetical protein